MGTPGMVGSIGMGSSLAGGVLSAFGSMNQGRAQSDMYQYQAGLARMNADIATQNAVYSRQQGELQAGKYGLKAAQQMGQIKTGQAASGLDVNSGSAVEVRKGQETVTHLDMDQIRSNAAKTAYDFDVQSENFRSQASIYDASAENSSRAGMLGALSSIVGTAGSVSSRWLQGRQVGLAGTGGFNFGFN
jgi:hypothetical protein